MRYYVLGGVLIAVAGIVVLTALALGAAWFLRRARTR
jgi:hypothetical protein